MATQEILQPGLATEVGVLLGPEPVGDAAFWQLDVGVGEHLVLGHGALQPAAFHQALGQVLLRNPVVAVCARVQVAFAVSEPFGIPVRVAQMRRHGVNAFLVGEAFMRAPDPGSALTALFG